MDPLSDVLSLLKLRSYVSGGFDARGDWAVQFGPHHGIKFHAVLNGACWVSVDGAAEPVKVCAGECFLLARGKPFRIASDMAVAPVDFRTLISPVHDGRIVVHNGGGEFLSIGGYFTHRRCSGGSFSEHAALAHPCSRGTQSIDVTVVCRAHEAGIS